MKLNQPPNLGAQRETQAVRSERPQPPQGDFADYSASLRGQQMPSPRPWKMIRYLTNPPGHLWRDKWTTLSGPLPKPVPACEDAVLGVGARSILG